MTNGDSRSFVSTTYLAPAVAKQYSQPTAKPVAFHPRQPPQPRVFAEATRLRSKFQSLHSLTKNSSLVCFRCEDSGHLAKSCHNAIVCFACNRLGHHLHSCRAITMLPSSSRPPLTPAMKARGGALLVMQFGCPQTIRDMDDFYNGVLSLRMRITKVQILFVLAYLLGFR